MKKQWIVVFAIIAMAVTILVGLKVVCAEDGKLVYSFPWQVKQPFEKECFMCQGLAVSRTDPRTTIGSGARGGGIGVECKRVPCHDNDYPEWIRVKIEYADEYADAGVTPYFKGRIKVKKEVNCWWCGGDYIELPKNYTPPEHYFCIKAHCKEPEENEQISWETSELSPKNERQYWTIKALPDNTKKELEKIDGISWAYGLHARTVRVKKVPHASWDCIHPQIMKKLEELTK